LSRDTPGGNVPHLDVDPSVFQGDDKVTGGGSPDETGLAGAPTSAPAAGAPSAGAPAVGAGAAAPTPSPAASPSASPTRGPSGLPSDPFSLQHGKPSTVAAGGGQTGGDFYHGNSQAVFDQTLENSAFIGIKASQGGDYVDPAFKSRWAQAGALQDQGKLVLRIAYDFLSRDTPGAEQAALFLKTVGITGPVPKGIKLALDWEAKALQKPQVLKDAAQKIFDVTQEWPIVYTSSSSVSDARKTVPGAVIWEARYRHDQKVDRSQAFTQYSEKPYDADVFNGTHDELQQFADSGPTPA